MIRLAHIHILLTLLLGTITSCTGSEEEVVEADRDELFEDDSEFDDYDDDYDYTRSEDGYLVDSSQYDNALAFIDLIFEKDYQSLSKRIDYPLERWGPLPHIMNEDDFIERAPIIFDKQLIRELREFKENPEIFDYTGSNGTYWTEDYNLLFWGNGQLKGILYNSEQELKEADQLQREIKQLMHHSLDEYHENYFFGETEKFIFRIDYVDDSTSQIRYASWSKGRGMNEKPDMICYDGFTEKMGTWRMIRSRIRLKKCTYKPRTTFLGDLLQRRVHP